MIYQQNDTGLLSKIPHIDRDSLDRQSLTSLSVARPIKYVPEGHPHTEAQDRFNRLLACGLWLFGCSCWVLGYIYPNVNNVPPQVTNIWRASLIILLNYLMTYCKQVSLDIVDESQYNWCVLRSLLICFNIFVFTISQFYVPLPIAHTINCSSPIFGMLFDWWLNSVRLTKRQIQGIVISFVGIAILIFFSRQPSLEANDTRFQNYIGLSTNNKILMVGLLALNAASFGFNCVIIKKMPQVHSSTILAYTGIALMFFCALLYPTNLTPDLQKSHPPNSTLVEGSAHHLPGEQSIQLSVYLLGFIFSGTVFALGQLAEIWALKICRQTGRVLIMQNFTVVIAYCISVGYFGESVHILSLSGAVLVVGGVIRTIK